jgi:enamine deaminase RidA (YjgF/YER057c/UK114 family)
MNAITGPLFERETWHVRSPAGGKPADQFRESFLLLKTRLRSAEVPEKGILRLTAFSAETNPARFGRLRKRFLEALSDSFGPVPPPASLVAQPPEKGAFVALEVEIAARSGPGVRFTRKLAGGLPYLVVTGPGVREVYGAGIVSEGPFGDVVLSAAGAFERMRSVLDREGLTFGDVVRQWNYIQDILSDKEVRGTARQNYQAFNDVRSEFYAASRFPFGYPAATGIGQQAGGILLEFVAVSAPSAARIIPVSNPRQTDAHRYSERVLTGEPGPGASAKSPPKFERAKIVAGGMSGIVYVSGTAAVVGEKSAARQDVESQTRTTLANISVLTGGINLRRAGLRRPPAAGGLSFLRAYVKRGADIPRVRRVCEEAFGAIPALFVQADICREELLVEIEGALVIGPS